MRWSGDVAIITGRYVSEGESTIMELWSRARSGESVLLRVHGVKPWFEITPHGRWEGEHNTPPLPEEHEEIKTVQAIMQNTLYNLLFNSCKFN